MFGGVERKDSVTAEHDPGQSLKSTGTSVGLSAEYLFCVHVMTCLRHA